MDEIKVYSLKLANKLINKGYKLINTEINLKFPQFKIFVFEGSDDLISEIQTYKETKLNS